MIAAIATVTLVAWAGSARVDPPRRYASITVDTEIEGETGDVLERRIRERGDVALRSAAVLPARDAEDVTIAVSVREDETDSSYGFELRTIRGGAAVGDPIVGTCRLCTEGELVTAIEGRLAQVIATLEPTSPSASVPPPQPSPAARADAPRRAPLGKPGIAGVTLLATGAVALATGIGLVVAPDRDADDPRYDVTTRPVGWALLGTGGAIAIAGAVLVGVDRKQARRRTRLALAPRKGGIGIAIAGRF